MSAKHLGIELAWESSKGVLEVSLSGAGVMRLLARIMLGLVFGNVLLSCLFSIPCSQLLPTISYLGCFPGHERMHVFSCVFFSLSLFVLYLGPFVRLSNLIPPLPLYTSLVLGLGITGLLNAITIVDEVNGLYFSPIDWMHDYMVVFLLLVCGSYIYLAYGCLSDIQDSMCLSEQNAMVSLRFHIGITVAALLLAVIEWQVAYSVYANSLFNETMQALCEWGAISLAVLLPVSFCRCLEGYKITLAIPIVSGVGQVADSEMEGE
jgi:hypothetical protein